MKRALILGVFALVAAVSGQNVEAASVKLEKRRCWLPAKHAASHIVKLEAGRQAIAVMSKSDLRVGIFKLTRDAFGEPELTSVSAVAKRTKDDVTAWEFAIPRDGIYVIVVTSSDYVDSYMVFTTGEFIGKPKLIPLKK